MISILIPLYNGVEFLNESISSVVAQTYTEWEVIIGVNGHPPDSPVFHKAKQYERVSDKIRVVEFPDIRDKSAALNEMVRHAKYSHIALLDVDDIWLYDKLEKQIPFIESGYDVVGARCIYFGERSRLQNIIPTIPTGDISKCDFKIANPVINSSAVIKREHCIWDGSLNLEDYDMWLRLRQSECRFYNCSDILVRHRLHPESAFNAKGNSNNLPQLLAKYNT